MAEVEIGERTVELDDGDWDRLRQHQWHLTRTPNRWSEYFYAARGKPGGGVVLMHREIANPPDGYAVDHADGNTLNNRRANLRVCARWQNACNRRATRGYGAKSPASRYKGVSRAGKRTQRKPWATRITAGGKTYHMGYFATEVEAAQMYDKAARYLHGRFAVLNFPEHGERPALP